MLTDPADTAKDHGDLVMSLADPADTAKDHGDPVMSLAGMLRETANLLSWYRQEGFGDLEITETLHVGTAVFSTTQQKAFQQAGTRKVASVTSPSASRTATSISPPSMQTSHKVRHALKMSADKGAASRDNTFRDNTFRDNASRDNASRDVAARGATVTPSKTAPRPPDHRSPRSSLSVIGSLDVPVLFLAESWAFEAVSADALFTNDVGILFLNIVKAMHLTRDRIGLCTFAPLDYVLGAVAVKETVMAISQEVAALLTNAPSGPPKIICAMGDTALKVLLGGKYLLSRSRGRFHVYPLGGSAPSDIPVMPTHHPATLLKAPEKKRDSWEDMKQIMAKAGL